MCIGHSGAGMFLRPVFHATSPCSANDDTTPVRLRRLAHTPWSAAIHTRFRRFNPEVGR